MENNFDQNANENRILEWVNGNTLGVDIVKKKYLQSGETFDEWIDRVSSGNNNLKRLILEKKFLPGGRILANRGINKTGSKGSLSNCYVLGTGDSIEEIYETCAQMARTYSYGGGVGIDISKLRPRGAFVNNTAKETTGAVSFMKTFDVVTGTIGQSGRRGALMISISANHPDLPEFIGIKANTDLITNANISIRVNDKFMKSVEEDKDYLLHWPCDMDINEKEIENIDEYDKLVKIETMCGNVYVKKVKARELFMKIAANNWDYGEPGVLFWDRIENWHLMSNNKDFEYAGVNPCAEEPLPKWGACLLGSMNISAYVTDDKRFDYESFDKDVKTATVALNEIQVEGTPLHPLDVQKEAAVKYRQIGLGLFDLAGALIKLGIRYGSKEAQEFADKVTHSMLISAFEKSCDLNEECGINAVYDNMFDSDFYKKRVEPFISEKYKGKYPLNSQILTIAPTGSISTMINASSGGGEPVFALSYSRTTKSLHGKDETYNVYPQVVLDYFGKNEISDDEFSSLPDYYVSSSDIPWKERVEMQASMQNNIDASISSTVNLPEKTTVDDVFGIYMYAWKCGLKGITIFRENCKRMAILSTSPKQETKPDFPVTFAPKRPKSLDADFYQISANGHKFHIFVGIYAGRPYEFFAMPCGDDTEKIPNHKGKITKVKKRVYRFDSDLIHIDNIAVSEVESHDILGEISKISSIVNEGNRLTKEDVAKIKDMVYNIKSWSENNDREYRNVSLHVSGALRHGMPIKSVISLEGKCNDVIVSFNSAVSRILSKYIPKEVTGEVCPDCGSAVVREGGCVHCSDPACGWSRCE